MVRHRPSPRIATGRRPTIASNHSSARARPQLTPITPQVKDMAGYSCHSNPPSAAEGKNPPGKK
eukprot:4254500-Amphidinium_carterae.1